MNIQNTYEIKKIILITIKLIFHYKYDKRVTSCYSRKKQIRNKSKK